MSHCVDPRMEADAMDKIVGHINCIKYSSLNVRDFAEIILDETPCDKTGTTTTETREPVALCVETKPCSIILTRLENILKDEIQHITPTEASDLPSGIHFTQSKTVPVHTGRKPRKASTGVVYDTNQESDSNDAGCFTPNASKPSHSAFSQE